LLLTTISTFLQSCGTGRAVDIEQEQKDERQQIVDATVGPAPYPLGPDYPGVSGQLQWMKVRNYNVQADGTLAPLPTDAYAVTLRSTIYNVNTKIPICIDLDLLTWDINQKAYQAENEPSQKCAQPQEMTFFDAFFTVSIAYLTPERVGRALPSGRLTGDGIDLTHEFHGCGVTRVDTARNLWSVQCSN
jgi:hypothetical protein